MILIIFLFALLAIVTGVTWVIAQSEKGDGPDQNPEIDEYLPIVLRQWDPLVLERERNALVALYQSTDGVNWIKSTNWLSNEYHCIWYGVVCVNGRITELRLHRNRLNGPIPAELGDLSNLEILDLLENQLSGPIPAELGNLGNLRSLWLDDNQLSGNIPKELGKLSRLRSLELYINELTGPIPSELGNLGSLGYLHLSYNQLGGPIPAELGNLSNLESLWLNDNNLTCWATSGVLEWALGVKDHYSIAGTYWDYPAPGETICP